MPEPAAQPKATVLVIANSVGLPVASAGDRSYIDELAELVSARCQVERWVGSGLHIAQVVSDLDAQLDGRPQPDALVVQLGIVESCPRPLSERERSWVEHHRSRLVRGAVILLVRHLRAPIIRLRRLHQRVAIDDWRRLLAVLLDRCDGRPVWLLGIFPTWTRNDRQSPGYQRQIAAYNTVLAELAADRPSVSFVPPDELLGHLPAEQALTDGIHLSAPGLTAMARRLSDLLLDGLHP